MEIKLENKKIILTIYKPIIFNINILRKFIKKTIGSIFSFLYAPRQLATDLKSNKVTIDKVYPIESNTGIKYKVYQIFQGCLFTNSSTYVAIYRKKSLLPGASSQWQHDVMLPPDKNPVLSRGTPKPITRYKGNLLSLVTRSGKNNYYHWLYDVLPRINLCKNVININDVEYILVPQISRRFQLETLDLLNINSDKLVSSEIIQHLKADNLIVTDHPNPDWTNPQQWIVSWLREKFLSQVKEKKNLKIDFNTYVYIKRGDSNRKRYLLNEDKVSSFLQKKGFTSYTLSKLSVLEQICLFSNAEVIVGVHGAGFTNLTFAKKETKVVEMFSEVYKPKLYEIIADYNSLNYTSIVSDSVESNERPTRACFNVSIEDLKQYL